MDRPAALETELLVSPGPRSLDLGLLVGVVLLFVLLEGFGRWLI